MKIKDYIKPSSLDEAYSLLNKNRNNRLIGGGVFLKQSDGSINSLIDLYDLGLDYIEDYEDRVEIGAMTSFRDLEKSKVLKDNFGDILKDSVKDVVGVQFKNSVTVGGSVYPKYGFSDLITGLMVLDTHLILHKYGEISLEEYLDDKNIEKDILTKIIIYKDERRSSFKSFRNSDTGFSLLNVAVSRNDKDLSLAVGARPARAVLKLEKDCDLEDIDKLVEDLLLEVEFGSNYMSSSEYRESLSKVLTKRALLEVL